MCPQQDDTYSASPRQHAISKRPPGNPQNTHRGKMCAGEPAMDAQSLKDEIKVPRGIWPEDRKLLREIKLVDTWGAKIQPGTSGRSFQVPPSLNKSGPPLYLTQLQTLQRRPQKSWAPKPRVLSAPYLEQRRQIAAASREWCAIPDTDLLVPWSCNWSEWNGWSYGPEPLQDDLRRRYNIAGPLSPIMFRGHFATLLESYGTFYLLHPMIERTRPSGRIVSRIEPPEKLPLTRPERGVPPAARSPRALRETQSPRDGQAPGCLVLPAPSSLLTQWSESAQNPPHAVAWPTLPDAQLPDAQLPAPLTCAWHAAGKMVLNRAQLVGAAALLLGRRGPHDDCLFYTVLRAGETYYLWLYEGDRWSCGGLRGFCGECGLEQDFGADGAGGVGGAMGREVTWATA
ncbi:hypothetical protein DFH09DRAFT_1084944 [Mycena vulgaris]|nr:hypothetical protein DFH09DRAFT_1084944 [Mycena vulgaris]